MLHCRPQPVPTTSCRGTKGQFFPYRVCPQQVETWQMLQSPDPGLTGIGTPDSPPTDPAAWLTCRHAAISARAASAPLPRYCERRSRRVLHPRFKRLFRGLMSLGRRSHGPADVIPHVWRCHCSPERTLSESVHWFRPVEGRFTPVPATKSRLWPLNHQTQTPVHPRYCVEGAQKTRACSPPHPCADP